MNKKAVLCLVWIGSALLIGFLLWFFTLSYRTRLLIETVNKTLALNGGGTIEMQDGFFTSAGSPASVMGGSWFALSGSSDSAFVFTMIQNGITAACVALVDNSGKVKTILPLSSNARQLIEGLAQPIFRFYTDRIEQDAQNRNVKRETSQ